MVQIRNQWKRQHFNHLLTLQVMHITLNYRVQLVPLSPTSLPLNFLWWSILIRSAINLIARSSSVAISSSSSSSYSCVDRETFKSTMELLLGSTWSTSSCANNGCSLHFGTVAVMFLLLFSRLPIRRPRTHLTPTRNDNLCFNFRLTCHIVELWF